MLFGHGDISDLELPNKEAHNTKNEEDPPHRDLREVELKYDRAGVISNTQFGNNGGRGENTAPNVHAHKASCET